MTRTDQVGPASAEVGHRDEGRRARAPVALVRLLDRLRGRPGLVVAVVLGTLPALRVLWWVRGGSVVQFNDYWQFAPATFRPDGWPSLSALTEFQNEHLVTVPQLVYWANLRLFGGSNITLGYLVVGVALAQVALLWTWIRRTRPAPAPLRVALAVAVSALTFAPHGGWSFLISMSGTAWLLANLLAVTAITVMVRVGPWPAVGLAVVATATYGTGVATWPALLAVALLGERRRRAALPVVVGAVPTLAVYLRLRSQAGRFTPGPEGLRLLENMAAVVGGLFARDEAPATVLGGAVLVALVVLTAVDVRSRQPAAVPWIGLAVFGVTSVGLIGHLRDLLLFDQMFLAPRYTPITSVVWMSLLGLLVTVAGPRTARWSGRAATAFVSVIALLAAVAGVADVRAIQDTYIRQQEVADAQRLGVSAGGRWYIDPLPDLTPLLRSLGHHPFDARYEGGCGLIGTTVAEEDLQPIVATPDVRTGTTAVSVRPNMAEAAFTRAWVSGPGPDVECGGVLDVEGEVIGVVRAGFPGPAGQGSSATGLQGISSLSSGGYRLFVRFEGSDELYVLPPTGPED